MNLCEKQFLDGVTGIKVTSLNQSRFLIKLAEENNLLNNDNDNIEDFTEDSFIKYSYYFIENNCQLQANMTESGALEEVKEVVDFETMFGSV